MYDTLVYVMKSIFRNIQTSSNDIREIDLFCYYKNILLKMDVCLRTYVEKHNSVQMLNSKQCWVHSYITCLCVILL